MSIVKKLKPGVLEKLKALNHEKIGRMVDALGLQPQTLRNWHFEKESKALVSYEFAEQIVKALGLENISDVVEEIKINEE